MTPTCLAVAMQRLPGIASLLLLLGMAAAAAAAITPHDTRAQGPPCTIHVSPATVDGTGGNDSADGLSWGRAVASVHRAADILQTLLPIYASQSSRPNLQVNAEQTRASASAAAPSSTLVVCLAAGAVHSLGGRPLVLDRRHSAAGVRVVWRSAAGAEASPAVINGGARLDKWIRCNDGVHCPGWEGVWVHFLSDIAGLPAAMTPPRQLWIGNSTRATRSFIEGGVWGMSPTKTGYTATTASALPNLAMGEMRWPRQIRNWIEPRCVINSSTTAPAANISTTIVMEPACWQQLIARHGGLPPAPIYIENVMESTLGEGEFVANDQYLFYRPAGDFP